MCARDFDFGVTMLDDGLWGNLLCDGLYCFFIFYCGLFLCAGCG